MRALLAVTLLALAACAPGASVEPVALTPEAAPEAAPVTAPAQNSRWLEPGALGHEEQAAWGLPLPEDFRLEVLPVGTFFDRCDALGEPCPRSTSGWTELALGRARVVLRDDLSREDSRQALLHELGHVFRGEDGHLACEGEDAFGHVMCPRGNATVLPNWPTEADFDFVLRTL